MKREIIARLDNIYLLKERYEAYYETLSKITGIAAPVQVESLAYGNYGFSRSPINIACSSENVPQIRLELDADLIDAEKFFDQHKKDVAQKLDALTTEAATIIHQEQLSAEMIKNALLIYYKILDLEKIIKYPLTQETLDALRPENRKTNGEANRLYAQGYIQFINYGNCLVSHSDEEKLEIFSSLHNVFKARIARLEVELESIK